MGLEAVGGFLKAYGSVAEQWGKGLVPVLSLIYPDTRSAIVNLFTWLCKSGWGLYSRWRECRRLKTAASCLTEKMLANQRYRVTLLRFVEQVMLRVQKGFHVELHRGSLIGVLQTYEEAGLLHCSGLPFADNFTPSVWVTLDDNSTLRAEFKRRRLGAVSGQIDDHRQSA